MYINGKFRSHLQSNQAIFFVKGDKLIIEWHPAFGDVTDISFGYYQKLEAPEFNADVSDIQQLRVKTQEKYPKLPYFMMGHSMGSFMLRKYLAFHNENLRGAIIMGTGFIPGGTTKLALWLTDVVGRMKGTRHRSPLLAKLLYGPSYKNFDTTGKEPEKSWLTKDTEIVKKYYKDPCCTFRFTVNGYRGLFDSVNFSCNKDNVKKIPAKLPIFIVSGKEDPVGDLGKGVMKVYEMFEEAGSLDVTYQVYKNDRHEILNETDKEMVFSDLLAWMNVRIDT
jgi:alpha-beta hydrolase superfamily lysophospholipase